ncbi:siderophore-interacting protein [Glycomyces buryatensis]|uniref:Siderophore-interacting protein n=1 Tax=Glycomyces buryatensis TaxID=2570927 RepID=A0A4S8Q875_9ACTN|nr:siderophore-interacting protein [Glycomyces buryatensis]
MQTAGLSLTTVRPYQPFPGRVKEIRRLSPSFVRVTFASEELRLFADNGFDQRIKLIFPAPACGFEKFPGTDRWYSDLRALPDEEQCRVRTYTVRGVRRELGEVDIDMVVHEPHGNAPAPALRWILDAEVGDELILLGPDARFEGPQGGIDFHAPEGAELLLGGDETAMPAIAAILERLPITARGKVFIEVPLTTDILDLSAPPEVRVSWLPRDGAPWGAFLVPQFAAAAAALQSKAEAQPVEDIDVDAEILWDAPEKLDACESYVWLAAEAGVVKTLRRTVRQELGFPKECGAFMGYWRLGKDAD